MAVVYLIFRKFELVLKKILHISLSLVLALSIVLGYTGVTVFKMVCASENGKVVLSVVDVKEECEHSREAEPDDCCKPVSKQNKPQEKETKSCCNYSYQFQKMDDESLVEQQQNSANHYLQVIILTTAFVPVLVEQVAGLSATAHIPPPLLSLKKQPFQAFTQSYLI